MTFAACLRSERTARGLSKRALALRAGLSPAYVTLLEQGRRAPTRTAVEALGAALEAAVPEGTAPHAGITALLLSAAGYAPSAAHSQGPAEAERSHAPRFRSPGALAAALADDALPAETRAQLDHLITDLVRALHDRARQGLPLGAGPENVPRSLSATLQRLGPDEEEVRRALDELRSPVYDL